MRRAGTLVALLAALTVAAASGGRSKPAHDLLPDLVQKLPRYITVDLMRTGDQVTFRLGFASAFENRGAGPLEIVARRPEGSDAMRASQVVYRSDGSARKRPGAGTLRYAAQPTHGHWHLRGFDRYRLTKRSGDRLAAPSRKMGFCLGDGYRVRGTSDPAYTERCTGAGPDATTLREGLSPGWGDVYRAYVEDQFLDITNVRGGRYVLVNRVNADRAIEEASYGNNAASVLIDLRWPDGRDHFPTLRVVARCPHSARCSG